MSGLITTLVSAIIEAWGEIRSHKLRIGLSLFGVALSVASLVTVVALGGLARDSFETSMAASGGRRATITFQGGAGKDSDTLLADYERIVETYRVDHAAVARSATVDFQTPRGVYSSASEVVTADFALLHGISTNRGRWFEPGDTTMLAPAVVVNDKLWELLGSPAIDGTATVDLVSGSAHTARLVGTVAAESQWDSPKAFVLWNQGADLVTGGTPPRLELWVPEDLAKPIEDRLAGQAEVTGGQVMRTDAGALLGDSDPFLILQVVLGSAAVLIMSIGALGLLSVSMTTMEHRVREIGIRRSFGATGRRIFFGVLMESVVATFLAGLVGVVVAVVVLRQPIVLEALFGSTVPPAVPVSAALAGIASATGVGALAGLIPAGYAANAPVIEAIRF